MGYPLILACLLNVFPNHLTSYERSLGSWRTQHVVLGRVRLPDTHWTQECGRLNLTVRPRSKVALRVTRFQPSHA